MCRSPKRVSAAFFPLLTLAFLLLALVSSAPLAHAESVATTITVGNNPWGVAYDSGAGEVFVANSGSGRTVSIISDTTNAVVATITLPSGDTSLTNLAYDSAKGEIFVASQGGGVVTVYCDGTVAGNCPTPNSLVATIGPAVSGLPCSATCSGLYVANGVTYDSGTGEIFVTTGDCVGGACYAYVISDSTNTVIAAVPIGSSPGYATGLAYDSGAGEIFVPIYSSGKIQVICDGTNSNICSSGPNTVAATLTLPSGSQPEVIAYDSGKGEVFVANYGGTVLVYCDGTNPSCGAQNSLKATINFASDLNPGIGYDSRTGEVFVSVLSYYVSVISDSTNTITGTVYVGLGPYGIAYDSGKGDTYAAVSYSNSVVVMPDPTIALTPSGTSSGGSVLLSGLNYWSSSVLDGESCATYSGYIYCVGGYSGAVYLSAATYAQVSSGGVGAWVSGTAYPTSAFEASCAIDQGSGYMYCVGGYTGSGYSNAVYYAKVSSSGIGSWTSTTAYPAAGVDLESCATYSGYIYCVTGYTGSTYLSAVYYAQLSSGGGIVGNWSSTSTYPSAAYGVSCVIDSSSGYIYCLGGYTGSNYLSTVDYASVSSGGVGTWASTTAYPTGLYVGSCAEYSGYMYCVDGYTGSVFANAVYYAQLLPSGGVGAASWSTAATYPISIDRESCATYSSYIYCVGGNTGSGYTGSVYYGQASSSGVSSWTSTSQYSISHGYDYCFEPGVTTSPSSCPSTNHFTASPSGGIPPSTTLTVSGSTGLVVVSDAATGAVVSSALMTLYADPTVAVTPNGPLTYDAGQTVSGLTASITYLGSDTTPIEWYSSTSPSCSASSTDTHTSGLEFSPSSSLAGTTYYCAVVSDSGVPGYTYSSNAVEVIISADPTVTVTTGPIYFDAGQASTNALTATATYSGTNTATINWYASSSGVTCTETGSALGSGTSPLSYTPSTTSVGATYYCAQITDSGVGLSSYVSYSNVVAVTVNSALSVPSTPTISASVLDADQTEAVTGTIPSSGTSTYGYQWLVSVNSGLFAPASLCTTNSGSGAAAGATETCNISSGTLSAGDAYSFKFRVTDSSTTPEIQTSPASSTVAVSSALTTPSAPAVSAATLDVDQAETVTGTIPSTGTSTYSWQWLVSENGGTYATTTLCATSSDTGAAGGAAETCALPGNILTAGDTYSFELRVTDSASTPETLTSSPSNTVAVSSQFTGSSVTISSSMTIDQGQSVTLTITWASAGTLPHSVQLETSSSASCTASTNVGSPTTGLTGVSTTLLVSPTSTTFYCAAVTDNANSPESASTRAAVTITVNSALGTPSIAPSTQNIGYGQTASFNVAWSGGSTTYTVALYYTSSQTSCTTLGTQIDREAGVSASPSSFNESGLTIGPHYVCATVTDNASTPETTTTASPVTVIVKASSSASVSCSPESVAAGSSTTCTVSITGSSPTGAVSWSSSSSTGQFSSSSCSLSSGSCSVTYDDTTPGDPVVTATYGGDPSNTASSGFTVLANFQATLATAASSSSTTVAGGSTSADQTSTTGVSTSISGSTAPNGTSVSIFSSDLSSQPSGTGTVSLSGGAFFDVKVAGLSDGSAYVCFASISTSTSTAIQYFSGGSWISATGVVATPGVEVCGNIPVSALTGTYVVIGSVSAAGGGGGIPMSLVTITLVPDRGSQATTKSNYFTVSYTGNEGAASTTVSGSSALAFWARSGSTVTVSGNSSGSGANEKWCLNMACSAVTISAPAQGDSATYTYFYYDLLSQVVSYLASGGSPAPPSLSYQGAPSAARSTDSPANLSLSLLTSAQDLLALRGTNASVPSSITGASGQTWTTSPSSWVISNYDAIPNPIVYKLRAAATTTTTTTSTTTTKSTMSLSSTTITSTTTTTSTTTMTTSSSMTSSSSTTTTVATSTSAPTTTTTSSTTSVTTSVSSTSTTSSTTASTTRTTSSATSSTSSAPPTRTSTTTAVLPLTTLLSRYGLVLAIVAAIIVAVIVAGTLVGRYSGRRNRYIRGRA